MWISSGIARIVGTGETPMFTGHLHHSHTGTMDTIRIHYHNSLTAMVGGRKIDMAWFAARHRRHLAGEVRSGLEKIALPIARKLLNNKPSHVQNPPR